MKLRTLAAIALLSMPGMELGAGEMKIDYPAPWVLCQRDRDDSGEIPIRGRFEGLEDAGRIEARFAGGEWTVVDATPQKGTFRGRLRVRVGEGRLEVRASAAPALSAAVEPVAVGDLFLITGQSNADGRGDAHITLRPDNPCLGAKYRGGAWSRGDDPSDHNGKHGSPWPIVLNALIPEQEIPIGFIQAAVGSTVVKQWRKGGSMYARMLKLVAAATDGTMAVKAVCYYQGENDITHYNKLSVLGDYAAYKENLLAAATDFHNEFGVPFIVGQLTNLGDERERNDNVRRAHQEVWLEHPHACRGAITYDILPSDGVHYRTEPNMRAFARRWTLAIRAAVYGAKNCAPPALQRAERLGGTSIRLVFDRALKIEKWDGTPGEKALGFRFRDGESVIQDAGVASTVVDGSQVVVRLRRLLSAAALLDYGSGRDGQNQPVLRDVQNGLPA
jgi:hypothetical protein